MTPPWPFQSESGSITGTTTNNYVAALTWVMPLLKDKTITLKNTHGSNGLKYKLDAYATETGVAYELVSEATLAASSAALFQYQKPWSKFVLSVKAAVDDAQATYTLEYIGQTY